MNIKIYIPLRPTARLLGLPVTFLKELVENNKIPSLNVNGRLRFNLVAVQQALADLAAKGGSNE